jgi:hypothetical protein
MRRSFIFSSDPGTRDGRKWVQWTALTALLLAITEGMLRVPAIQDVLPTRTHYYEPGIAVREDALRRTLAANGRIDALFIGSSIVRTNIQPLTFDQLVQSRTQQPIVSFNAGLSGLWPEGVALYLDRVWLPLAKPRLVIQGIRYPELAATTHALRADRVFSGAVESGWRETTWRKRAYSAAVSRVRLLQYRGVLPELLQRYTNGRPGPLSEPQREFGIDPRGYTPRLPTFREAQARGLIRREDPVSQAICPDGCSVGFGALSRAARMARQSGAEYILVNIPEHATRWHGEEGGAKYAQYLAVVRAFATAEGVAFLDPTEGDPYAFNDEEEYADTYHMTPAGAKRLTSILANRLSVRSAMAPGRHRAPDAVARIHDP